MKKCIITLFMVISVLMSAACRRDLNYIIDNEPNITGVVKEISDNDVLIENENGEYFVSLDVEYSDSMTHFNVGDEVTVYYDGNVAESYPMQISTVYAITLITPAERSENNIS